MFKNCLILFLLHLLSSLSLLGQGIADIVIKNARIIDGTGNPWYRGDILVSSGKIVNIVAPGKGTAQKVIDAKDMVASPGFIDVHMHLDGNEFRNPQATNFIYDGVTSVITGNCGSSKVDIKAYLNQLDSLRLSINVGTLVGHSTLRRTVVGPYANRPASEEEMRKMEKLLDQAMQDGAFGLSTGLIYIPGTYGSTDELIRLAKISALYNGIYTSHMRSEADSVVEAIDEALLIGKESGCRVELSHFKVAGRNNWGRSKQTLQQVINARQRGIDVVIDQFPYGAESTHLSTLLPKEFLSDGPDSVLARLKQPATRTQAKKFLLDNLRKENLKHFNYAVMASYPADPTLNGKSIADINVLKGRKKKASEEAETILELIEQSGSSGVYYGAAMIYHYISEDDLQSIMKYPHNICISDAGVRIPGSMTMLHPRAYGSNARVLARYVRELQLISLEEAIRRMTSLPAQHFKIEKKGLLMPGYDADIVIFDPGTVQDNATFESPYLNSSGFKYVLVNGQVVLNENMHTGLRPGKTLKRYQP
jgi:N-acyl-D-amino-acid deacylase